MSKHLHLIGAYREQAIKQKASSANCRPSTETHSAPTEQFLSPKPFQGNEP